MTDVLLAVGAIPESVNLTPAAGKARFKAESRSLSGTLRLEWG